MWIGKILLLLIITCLSACAAPQVKAQEEKPLPSKDAYYSFLLGYGAEKDGKWEDAVEHYREALGHDPSSVYLKTEISFVLLRLGKVSEALSSAAWRTLQQSEEAGPGHSDVS